MVGEGWSSEICEIRRQIIPKTMADTLERLIKIFKVEGKGQKRETEVVKEASFTSGFMLMRLCR